MDGYWRCRRLASTVSIRRTNGAWHVLLNGDSLGKFDTPQDAHKAIVSGQLIIGLAFRRFPKKLSAWPYFHGALWSDPDTSTLSPAEGLDAGAYGS